MEILYKIETQFYHPFHQIRTDRKKEIIYIIFVKSHIYLHIWTGENCY